MESTDVTAKYKVLDKVRHQRTRGQRSSQHNHKT